MISPALGNERVKLSLLTLDNYVNLLDIAQEKDLIHYSPSNISSPEHLRNYVQVAIYGYNDGTILPFIIFDKKYNAFAGSTRFGLIDDINNTLYCT